MSILDDKLKDFKYYVSKIPEYLKQSYGFKEQYRAWCDVLVGEEITPTYDLTELANADNVGKKYKYLGETTGSYVQGHIYECIAVPYYQVTYNINGGEGSIPVDDNLYSIGDTATIDFETLPTPVGQKDFLGWSTNATATVPEFTSDGVTTVEITGDIVLYAVYREYYLLTYDGNGNTSGTIPTDTRHYYYGETADVIMFGMYPVLDESHIFVGWSTNADDTLAQYIDINDTTIEMTHNTTLYAIYGEISTFANSSWQVIRAVIVRIGDITDSRVNWAIGNSKTVNITIGNTTKTYGISILDNCVRYNYTDDQNRRTQAVFGINTYWLQWGIYGKMNSTATNVGGWATCELNTGTLSDSGNNMNKIFSYFPDDLKQVIPSVQVLSGTGGSQSTTNTSASSCKVFLPAEAELVSPSKGIGKNECGPNISQGFEIYDFYRYYPTNLIKEDSNNNKREWWTRSPRTNNPSSFVYIDTSGNSSVTTGAATNGYGLTPVFAI